MASTVMTGKLKKRKFPKQPKMDAPKAAWDKFEKEAKEVNAHNVAVVKEKNRREAIKKIKK